MAPRRIVGPVLPVCKVTRTGSLRLSAEALTRREIVGVAADPFMTSIQIVEADLNAAEHQAAVVELLDAYATDPMGNGKPLADEVRKRLVAGLQELPTTLVFLAYDQTSPVGVAVCFRGFSTFVARPLINVHDLAVLPTHRGRGVGRKLLAAVETRARESGCCKLTREVLENNRVARRFYADFGFAPATYVPQAGVALFLAKGLL